MDAILTIIVAVIGSSALSSLIIFLITRHDNKKKIEKELGDLKMEVTRVQLLLMILLKPENQHEILTIAERYFGQQNGNWYVTPIFNRWCIDNAVAKPEWFSKE